MTLSERLRRGEFEFSPSVMKSVYYWAERWISHLLLRRTAPSPDQAKLLNLGCGPHTFPQWVNADDYALKRRWMEPTFRPDWFLDITRPWKCPDSHWDGIFSEHVIEHVTYSQAIKVLEECFRTMRPGSWIRISVPDLRKYVAHYSGSYLEYDLGDFPAPSLAISFLTQMHLHRSTWDGDLLTRLLSELGFTKCKTVAFEKGSDKRLIKDDPGKSHESVYVEAQKPSL